MPRPGPGDVMVRTLCSGVSRGHLMPHLTGGELPALCARVVHEER
jgi:hypothetical protein